MSNVKEQFLISHRNGCCVTGLPRPFTHLTAHYCDDLREETVLVSGCHSAGCSVAPYKMGMSNKIVFRISFFVSVFGCI